MKSSNINNNNNFSSDDLQSEQDYSKFRDSISTTSSNSIPTSISTNTSSSLDTTISAFQARKYKDEGNVYYNQCDYEKALEKYTFALKSAHATCDQRAVFLANRAAVYLKLKQYTHVVIDTTEALKLKPGYTKAIVRRKEANECLGQWDKALEDAKQLKMSHTELERLRLKKEEKFKQDSKQAMDSLKGLGNSILSNFGMSLDDFALEQDPSSGSYSVKMKNNGTKNDT